MSKLEIELFLISVPSKQCSLWKQTNSIKGHSRKEVEDQVYVSLCCLSVIVVSDETVTLAD